MKEDFSIVEKKINQIKKIYKLHPDRKAAINILEESTRSEIDEVLKYFSDKDPKIYVDINENIILFEDLVQLNQSSVKKICQKFSPELVGLALRLGNENLRKNFFQGISSDDREAIETIINGPPKKQSSVEAAIGQILVYVRSLEKEGLVKITGGDNEKAVFI